MSWEFLAKVTARKGAMKATLRPNPYRLIGRCDRRRGIGCETCFLVHPPYLLVHRSLCRLILFDAYQARHIKQGKAVIKMKPGSTWSFLARRGHPATSFRRLPYTPVWPCIQSRGAASLPGVTSLKKKSATGKGVDSHAEVRDMTRFPPDRIRCVRILPAFRLVANRFRVAGIYPSLHIST